MTIYFLYKKYKFNGYFFRHLFLVALSIPLFIDFVTLTDYIVSGFDSDKLCEVGYMDNENIVWFFPLNTSVLIVSIYLFIKTRVLHENRSLKLLGIYMLFYLLMRYTLPLIFEYLKRSIIFLIGGFYVFTNQLMSK